MPIVKVNSKNLVQFFKTRGRALLMLVSVVMALGLCSTLAFAQTPPPSRPAPTPPPPASQGTIKEPDEPPLTSFEEELRAKRAIKLAEKDHQENVGRAREIAQIGKELRDRVKDKTTTLDRESLKRIERLEKLTKKVRGEAGGEDEEVNILNRPSDVPSAVTQISEAAESLSKNVQNTPRQVVSASVIGEANVLLELIKVLRTLTRQP